MLDRNAVIPQPPAMPPSSLPSVTSSDLISKGREILILHAGEVYRLRITKRNKLILTK